MLKLPISEEGNSFIINAANIFIFYHNMTIMIIERRICQDSVKMEVDK